MGKQKVIRGFLYSASLLLFLTAVAKLLSACGSQLILREPDPILIIPFRQVLLIVGTVELGIACFCYFSKKAYVSAVLVAWLTTGFLVYRFGLMWIGYHKPCKCLGNLTDAIQMNPATADSAMKFLAAYLLIGSYVSVLFLWSLQRSASTTSALADTRAVSI